MARRTQPKLLGRLFAFLSTVLLLSLLTSHRTTGLVPNRAAASQVGTVVRIAPASQQIGIGETTTVEVRIDNVTGLAAAEMELHFNAAVLQVQDADPVQEGVQIQHGNFLAPDFVAKNSGDNATGVVRYALLQLPPHEPVSGSGLLASITFQGTTMGNSDLTFQMVNLSTNVGQAIPATSQGGLITVGGEQPTATFTPTPVPPTDTPVPGQPTPTPTPVPPTDTPVPGQPTPTPTPVPPTATPLPWPTPTLVPPGPTAVPAWPWPPTIGNRYVVQRGDTLYSIARRYGVSVWQLAAYNRIYNMNLIYAGQMLIIPGVGPAPGDYYVVKHRDTLYSISRRYGLSVWQLASYNHISNPHLIYIGQVLRIPPR